MSDQPDPQPAEQPDPGFELSPTAPRTNRTNLALWLYGLGLLALAAAVFYVWRYPNVPAETAASAASLKTVEQRLEAIDGRLGRLEQEPRPPTATDLNKITSQIEKLETQVSDQTQLASRLDVLSGRVESLSGRGQTGLDAIKQQLAQDADAVKQQLAQEAARTTALVNTVDSLRGMPDRISRLVRIQAAEAALVAGRPLGDLPDAPPALSRFAHNAPPTLAQLRLAFPEVERAALTADQPGTADGHFVDRLWERAQGLVTVRQGGQVVVGNATAVALARVRTVLEAGDLAAAVDATAALTPNAHRVAAEWIANAKALMDVRSALADMAAHT